MNGFSAFIGGLGSRMSELLLGNNPGGDRFSRRERGLVCLCFLLALALFIGGKNLPEVDAKEGNSGTLYQDLKVFTDVLSIVQRDYVSPVDTRKLVEGSIKGMLATLDPHSGYLDPDFYQDLQVQTKGEFGGLGIEITIKDGLLIVVSPMEGSPAERSGVRSGDAIVKIDGKFTKEYSLVDAVKKLRGPKGSSILLSISRKGSPDLIDVKITRDNIAVKSVRGRYLGDGFGYVRLNQFLEHTADDLAARLKELRSKSETGELKGLILDLRNNPGGLLTQAIRVSDMFLNSGIIVYTDGRVEGQKQKFFAHSRGTEPDYPMIVIVNGGSASASEIVAGAFKDHGRAIILGTKTFGKGSVQTISPLENGGALTLTTALYYTKSGNSLQGKGVKPDIEIDMPAEEEEAPETPVQRRERLRERDLPGAIKNPNGEDPEPNTLREMNKVPNVRGDLSSMQVETIALSEWLRKDPQLQRAVDLLKTFNVFRGVQPAGEAATGETSAAADPATSSGTSSPTAP